MSKADPPRAASGEFGRAELHQLYTTVSAPEGVTALELTDLVERFTSASIAPDALQAYREGRKPWKKLRAEIIAVARYVAAALAVYGEAGDSLVRRLKEEFNANRAQLLDLRQEILASGEVEKELASLILELLADRGLKMDPTVAEAAELFHIEELVE